MREPRTCRAGFAISIALALLGGAAPAAPMPADALAEAARIPRGICVLLGDRGARAAIDLAGRTELLIYVQLAGEEAVRAAREAADAAGLLGRRIFIDRGAFERIHIAGHVADILIAWGEAAGVAADEASRAVRPRGAAWIGGRRIVKPVPAGVDDWSHPYHGPDNNPQSRDTVARAPYLTQFLAGPYYAPLPQMTVAAGGRAFRATGHIAFKPREEAWLNALAAYNGYNGTILWRRALVPGIMVHRSTLIATDDTVFLGDDRSCKLIDAASGDVRGEIAPPEDVAGGTFWKWMALEGGTLYALIGEQEPKDPVVTRSNANGHGWPWNPLSRGFNTERNPWGFGKNLLAIDVATKEVAWHHREEEEIDSRAVCLRNGRLYAFRHGSFLACLDARTGSTIWRRTAADDPDVFRALGEDLNRQDWQTNWRTVAYLHASDDALYFAGPMMDKLAVLSTEDGRILWQHPYDNFQLVLRDDGLVGIGGGVWDDKTTKRFDPLTGRILGEYEIGRRACTRPTGAVDAVFCRANGGSIRFDIASGAPQYVSPMRPDCQDGVTIANGLLYWWPSVCDCQLTLYGTTCLGPAGDFVFDAPAREGERLERGADPDAIAPFATAPADWPTFRANNARTASSAASAPREGRILWEAAPAHGVTPTAPVAAGGLVFIGGSDGTVRALDAADGKPRWKAHTGGGIRVAPTVWEGRVLAGSGDGWVYAFEAATGRRLWRFRAAPVERKIPVYGALLSTWPAASGVLVEDGIAYVAAGISNFDGTHVFALDARNGSIRWQNSTSGHLNAEARTGIGVQGHLLLHGGRLYLAGGNAVSPGIYDAADGRCLNDGSKLNICESIAIRGWELYLLGDKVAVGGQPFYGDPEHPVVDQTVFQKALHASTGTRDLIWLDGREIRCYPPISSDALSACVFERAYPGNHIIKPWGKLALREKPLWTQRVDGSTGVALLEDAVIVLRGSAVAAYDLEGGKPLWTRALPAPAVVWGLAVDRDGRVIVSLKDGRIICVG
ncbi:MAG: PQQ-binding-like beta-propeller repeat protein [Planctomycetes bacterium]|nr:PQQ-binding-like beta-propeller repeat protein [Planctomycetota bacterium]